MCPQLSPDEKLASEESLKLYCRPIEWYNIIQHRAAKNPTFLQRCLDYMIEARRKKRIQLTVSLSRGTNTACREQNIFPLYVLLATPTSNISLEEHPSIYRFSRAYFLTSFGGFGSKDHTKATFVIPDIENLASSRASNLNIIIISRGQVGEDIGENNCTGGHLEQSALQKLEGKCFWGNISINLLRLSLENHASTLNLGHTMKLTSTVEMRPSFLEKKFLEQDNCLTFCSHKVDATCGNGLCLRSCLTASHAVSTVARCRCQHCRHCMQARQLGRLRAGNVHFNYKYYKNTMQKTEVTEDFACPFCFVKCGSYKGLGCHLNSSHDLFHFEFWISEERQAVDVSLKADAWRIELGPEGVDPIHQTFSYCSRFKTRRSVTTSVKISLDDDISVERASVDPSQASPTV
ncbi:polycomb group protein EMF2B-like [Triticum dicoccoides]|uniref:polycomb group protein EMF2B-like n=1 Tax=Triticum dicoccoides TaxID=85692 RepID=UPI00188E51DA|nr:polycomb group protein EMF2B-like [Triticum dicoccoides]